MSSARKGEYAEAMSIFVGRRQVEPAVTRLGVGLPGVGMIPLFPLAAGARQGGGGRA